MTTEARPITHMYPAGDHSWLTKQGRAAPDTSEKAVIPMPARSDKLPDSPSSLSAISAISAISAASASASASASSSSSPAPIYSPPTPSDPPLQHHPTLAKDEELASTFWLKPQQPLSAQSLPFYYRPPPDLAGHQNLYSHHQTRNSQQNHQPGLSTEQISVYSRHTENPVTIMPDHDSFGSAAREAAAAAGESARTPASSRDKTPRHQTMPTTAFDGGVSFPFSQEHVHPAALSCLSHHQPPPHAAPHLASNALAYSANAAIRAHQAYPSPFPHLPHQQPVSQAARPYGNTGTSNSSHAGVQAYCFDRGGGRFTRLVPADTLPPMSGLAAVQSDCSGMMVLPDPQAVSVPSGLMSSQPMSGVSGVSGGSGQQPLPLPPQHQQQPMMRAPPLAGSSAMRAAGPPPTGGGAGSHGHYQRPRKSKVYCDKWVHEGVCAFTQQGCKFKHEMPHDTATQQSLGLFQGYPAWYKRFQAEAGSGHSGGAGGASTRTGLRAGGSSSWRPQHHRQQSLVKNQPAVDRQADLGRGPRGPGRGGRDGRDGRDGRGEGDNSSNKLLDHLLSLDINADHAGAGRPSSTFSRSPLVPFSFGPASLGHRRESQILPPSYPAPAGEAVASSFAKACDFGPIAPPSASCLPPPNKARASEEKKSSK